MKSVGMETNWSIITSCGIGDYFILIMSVSIRPWSGSWFIRRLQYIFIISNCKNILFALNTIWQGGLFDEVR